MASEGARAYNRAWGRASSGGPGGRAYGGRSGGKVMGVRTGANRVS